MTDTATDALKAIRGLYPLEALILNPQDEPAGPPLALLAGE